ncbi:hypothetical protein LTR09_004369 [Extremus antarcticus]|uniref:Uncharacterized protein n=1 Tax=Extremus antarcticus TaxID=702011 RepID=A0AAJ0DR34_9PEZI|nr:hypothetical protein LTR09_004369 [Extremus antarcticus]
MEPVIEAAAQDLRIIHNLGYSQDTMDKAQGCWGAILERLSNIENLSNDFDLRCTTSVIRSEAFGIRSRRFQKELAMSGTAKRS